MEVKKELLPQDSIIKFCEECHNMLVPGAEEKTLVFRCLKPGCDFRLRVVGGSQRQCLVARRDFLDEKSVAARPEFALDPTMPRENVQCPECRQVGAVYAITTDAEDTKMILLYICANPACGHSWRRDPSQIR